MVTYRLSRRIHSAQYSHLKFVLYYKTTYFCIVWVLPGHPESGAGGEIPRLELGCRSFSSRFGPEW